jgi:Tfp pilus assembly protein PilF
MVTRKEITSSGWVVEDEEDEPGSRSCLAIRFGRHKKHPLQQDGASAASPGALSMPPKEPNVSPLYQSTSKLVTPQSKSPASSKLSSNPDSYLSRLLTPPTPEDRRKRAAYESQKRLIGVYEGEMEPEGHRGQEMSLPAVNQVSPESSESPIILRSFEKAKTSDRGGLVLLAPSTAHPLDPPSDDDNIPAPRVVKQLPPQVTRLHQSEISSGGEVEPLHRKFSPRSDPPAVTPRELPQFTPSLQASKASSPLNSSDENALADVNDGYSSTSSTSLKQIQEDFLSDMKDIPSDEDENDVHEAGDSPKELMYHGAPTLWRQRGLPATPTTPTTAAASSSVSVTSSYMNLSAANSSANVTTASAERNVASLHALAMERVHNGDLEAAVTILETVVNLQTHLHGAISPQVASAQHNLGTVHAKRAQLLSEGTLAQAHVRAKALQCFQTAARTARDSLGRYHGNVAVSLVRMGFLLLQAKQYQNAIVVFQEALRIRLSVFGSRHLLVANLYNNLGVCYMHLGEFAKGKEFLVAALDIQRDLTSDSIHHLELADTLFNIGGLCLEWIRRQGPDSRRADEAEDAFAEAHEVRDTLTNSCKCDENSH